MTLTMSTQDVSYQTLGCIAAALVLTLAPSVAVAQALYAERLAGGTEFVFVTQRLSEATTVSWSTGDGEMRSLTAGSLTLVPRLEEDLGGDGAAPAVVVATSGMPATEIRDLVARVLGHRIAEPIVAVVRGQQGGDFDRRLGAPGSEAILRLEFAMPEPDDWRRSGIEVLWEMLPGLLSARLPGVSGRIEDDTGRLEARVDPELVDFKLGQLRLDLARLAEDQRIDELSVGEAQRRVTVRRRALLANHPEAAETIARLWLAGGVPAVREFLFGVEGVTEEVVREAAVAG